MLKAIFSAVAALMIMFSPATAAEPPACSADRSIEDIFPAEQGEARLMLAMLQERQQPAATMQLRRAEISMPQAEIAAVRQQAQRVETALSRTSREQAEAAVAAVASYSGSDPQQMSRLLDAVDAAADRLEADLSAGTAGLAASNAFECNRDRRECKNECQAEKGKRCCCGCGVTYIACLFTG